MTQDPKNKPSSPEEIEFGDATLIGFNKTDAQPLVAAAQPPDRQATRSAEPKPAHARAAVAADAAPHGARHAAAQAVPQPALQPALQQKTLAPTVTQIPVPAKRTQAAPVLEEDFDRTVVDRSNPLGNPLKEAFDARTIVHSQPKQFNPEETQISPPPKVDRASAQPSPKSTVEKSRVPDSSAANFPESPTFGHTPIPESLKRSSQRKTLLEEAPTSAARSASRKTESATERSHERADIGETVDDTHDEVPTERKPSSLIRWIGKMRGSASRKQQLQREDNVSESNDVSAHSEPRNNRMRNALIAFGAAVFVAIAMMKFSHSSDDVAVETPPVAASAHHAQASRTSSASSGAPDGNAAPPPPPNQGQGGSRVAGSGVPSVIQQFDRAFVKTQDQR